MSHIVGQLAQVLLVGLGENDAADACPPRGQHLLLDAADGQHQPGEGDLAGHGRPAERRELRVERGHRHRHGDAGRGAVLGDGPGRHVDVQAGAFEYVAVDVELVGVRPQVALGRLGRLLHDVADLPGDDQPAPAGQQRGLDVEHLSAGLGPGQPGGHAGRQVLAHLLGQEGRRAEVIGQRLGGDRHRRRVALGEAQRHFAGDASDAALKLPQPRLACVARGDLPDRPVGEGALFGGQARLLELPRHQVSPGDLQLLFLAVAGQAQQLHAVQQRPRHRLQRVGGGDEEDLREVERQVEVVVAEALVLLGVEDLQQRGRRIAAEVAAELIDLVQHQQRIVGAGAADGLDNAAGHRPDVGAAVAAQLGLIVQAAQAHALELAAQRPRDRLAQRRLARARRADETQDRRLGLRVELQHAEVLEDALLDVLQVEVVLVEDLARQPDLEPVLGGLAPGQLDHEVQVGADHLVVGRGRRQPLQPPQLAVGLLAHLLGQVELGQPLAQLLDLGLLRVLFAQFLLDGVQLLPQQVLALLLGQLALGLAGDLAAQLQHLDLVGQVVVHRPQRLAAGLRLQQRLFLGQFQAEQRGQQVDQPQRVLGGDQQLVQLDRRLRLRQRKGLGGQLHHGAVQRLHLGGRLLRQRVGPHPRLHIRFRLLLLQQHHPLRPEHDQLHVVLGGARHPLDHRLGADGEKVLQAGLLDGRLPLGHDDNLFLLGGQRGVGGGQRGRPAHRQRHQQVREQHAVLQRQHRQDLDVPVVSHDFPLRR